MTIETPPFTPISVTQNDRALTNPLKSVFPKQVEYQCKGFLEKNRDTLYEELVDIMRASEVMPVVIPQHVCLVEAHLLSPALLLSVSFSGQLFPRGGATQHCERQGRESEARPPGAEADQSAAENLSGR